MAGAALLLGARLARSVLITIGAVALPLFMSGYDSSTVLFAQLCLAAVLVNTTQIVIKQAFAGTGQYWYCNLTHLLPQLYHLLALVGIAVLATLTVRGAALALFISGAVAVLSRRAEIPAHHAPTLCRGCVPNCARCVRIRCAPRPRGW